MRLSICPTKKENKRLVSIIQYVPNGKRGTSKVFKTLGYWEDLEKEHPDVKAWAQSECDRYTAEAKANRLAAKQVVLDIIPDLIVKLPKGVSGLNETRNWGYMAFLKYFRILSLDKKLYTMVRDRKLGFDFKGVVTMLVLNRLMNPDSKLGAWENKDMFFEDSGFELQHVYRSLTILAENKNEIIRNINLKVDQYTERKKAFFYYDVTNFYFEIMNEDSFRKNGCSKEHRPNPIVQLGLFIDNEGLPLSFETYEGSTPDVATFRDSIKTLRKEGIPEIKKTIFVADKGMMSGDNVASLRVQFAGYVISDSVRKTTSEMKGIILDDEGYIEQKDSGGILEFKYKEVDLPVVKRFLDAGEKPGSAPVNERIVIFWSRKYQQRASYEREKAVEKARSLAKSPRSVTGPLKGSRKYIKTLSVDNSTGQLDNSTYITDIDYEKINEEALLDGYYMIRTNVVGLEEGRNPSGKEPYYRQDGYLQLDQRVNARDVIDIYRGLWEIEESFRITKSELNARPVFVRTREHINAHLLICFISLLMIRLLERETKGLGYSAEYMLESLRKCNYVLIDKQEQFYKYCDQNACMRDIGSRIGIPLNLMYLTPAKIREIKGMMNNLRV